MKIRTSLTSSIALIALMGAAPVFAAENCRHSKDYQFTVERSGLTRVSLETGAGKLYVRGDESATQVRVTGTACADSRGRLDDLDLTHRVRGDELRVQAGSRPQVGFSFGFGSSYAYIDVEVILPPGLSVAIDDGSGDIIISSLIADLQINDGSGDIELSSVQGDVRIDDGSGGIDIVDLTGSVRITDGSGSITVRRVSGDVHIPDDGSGSIRISEVGGNVRIDDDGSGNIDVHDVEGDFIARNTGSGRVDYSNVRGSVDVRN